MTIERHPDNAPGTWFVNEDCIHCDICEEFAPCVFRASEDDDHHIVYQQPASPAELEQAEEARENCPAEAIRRGED